MNRLAKCTKLMNTLYKSIMLLRKYEGKPRHYGIDQTLYMTEMHVLSNIFANEGTTVTDLALETERTKSAVSQIVNKLENKCLIIKLRSEAYHKEVNLYMTEKGKQACRYHEALDKKRYRKILANLDDYTVEEFERFIKLHSIIIEQLLSDES